MYLLICYFLVTPPSLHFGLGQNSVTIKHVGHGWVCVPHHFETCTIKVSLSTLWDEHTIMLLMRIAVTA